MTKSISDKLNLIEKKEKNQKFYRNNELAEERETESQKIGKKINKLRLQKGLSQHQLAQKSGISQSFLSALENGKKSPTVDSLKKICRSLGISLAEFFSGGRSQRFTDLPPEINTLVDDLRELSPGQIQHLRAFIKSLNNQ